MHRSCTFTLLWRVAFACFLLPGLAALAHAQEVPRELNFQGRLEDAAGAGMSGPVTINISIFDAATEGVLEYAETHSNVDLSEDGVFHVIIGRGSDKEGSLDATTFANPELYLEMTVDDDVLQPRLPLTSVAYALRAQIASEVEVGAIRSEQIATNAVRRSEISGAEVGIYTSPVACGGGSDLSLSSTCSTVLCRPPPVPLYFTCAAVCSSAVPLTCDMDLVGYLLSPSIP